MLPTWEDVLLGPDSRKLSFVPNLKLGQISENEASFFASFTHVKSLPLTRVHTFAGERLVLYSFTKPGTEQFLGLRDPGLSPVSGNHSLGNLGKFLSLREFFFHICKTGVIMYTPPGN